MFVYGFLSDLNRRFYWSLPPPPDKPEPHRLFFDLVLTWQKEKVGGKVGRGLAGLGEEGLGTLGWGISSSGQTQPPTPNCYRLPLGAAFVIVTKAISSISKTVILWCFLYCFLPFCCYLIKNQSSKDKVSWLHINVRQISAFVKVILWYCGHEMK